MKRYLSLGLIIFLIVVLCIILSETTFVSVDGLMRPPKNEGQNSDIQAAFEASIEDKYILKSPLSGEYKSSFITVELDGDRDEEVVVFYSLSGTPDAARMNVIDRQGDSWRSIADFESAHKQIHKVDFADLDKDGKKEIIAGWSIFDTELSNTLNVYKLKNDGDRLIAEKIFENRYTEFIVCDVNTDGRSDILLFDKLYEGNKSLQALYFDFQGARPVLKGEFSVDPIIASVYSVSLDKDKTNGNVRFYLDGYRVDNGMTTELFYWNRAEKSFERPRYSNNVSLPTAATRSTALACADINDDGVIEIPFEEHIPGSELVSAAKSAPKKQSIIRWMKYNSYGFSSVYYEILNSPYNYSLKIKNEWYGNFTVKNYSEKGVLTFFSTGDFNEFPIRSFSLGEDAEKDLNTATDGGKPYYEDDPTALFTVAAFAENEGSLYDLSGYRYLKSDNGYNYYCRIYPEGKKRGITKDTVKKILIT